MTNPLGHVARHVGRRWELRGSEAPTLVRLVGQDASASVAVAVFSLPLRV
ncbi:hypothetical protein J2S41_007773 [Catenuloplanes atrovinosus]|uniref:Uncharacterized protein n=1 Tax=Catenuloplanes atrovinosus TaxID=137266 RepID=A0AAE4CGS3_9ACTN|nr:hypothetical protein [Catenuloplanes atrovinosus]